MAEKKEANPLGLPPVVQAGDVEVTRQRGLTGDMAVKQDPILNQPVIQVAGVEVTRQRGVTFVDAQGGIRVDRPADAPKDGPQPVPAFASDRRVTAAELEEKGVQLHDPNRQPLHQPTQVGETKVTRVGIPDARAAKAYLEGKTVVGDQPDPGKVHVVERPFANIPPEQKAAYEQGKHFASDTPAPGTRAEPVNWLAQQGKFEAPKVGADGQPVRAKAAKPAKAKAARQGSRTKGRARTVAQRSRGSRVQQPVAKPAETPAVVTAPATEAKGG